MTIRSFRKFEPDPMFENYRDGAQRRCTNDGKPFQIILEFYLIESFNLKPKHILSLHTKCYGKVTWFSFVDVVGSAIAVTRISHIEN